jgi:hypothetical protein
VDEDDEGYKRFRLQQRSAQWEEAGQHAAPNNLATSPLQLDSAVLKQVCAVSCLQAAAQVHTATRGCREHCAPTAFTLLQ